MGGMSNLSGGGGRFTLNSSIPLGDDVSSGFVKTTMGGINFNRDFSEKLPEVILYYHKYGLDHR